MEEIKALKLPKSVAAGRKKGGSGGLVLTIEQIFNAKSNFSVVEKIMHLERLSSALSNKLKIIEQMQRRKEARRLYRPVRQSVIV